MNALNVYFNGLDQQLFETSEELKVFVGLYSERDLRPIPTDAPSLRIPIDNIELQQVLVSEVEYFIVYSTQKVYIQSTLETIRVALSTLDDLKTEISSIFGTQERLEFIKTNNSSRKSAVQALKETQHVLTLLIEEKEVQQHFAYDIFKTILVYIDAGLDWDNSLDGMISKELTHCSNLLWKKIKNFEDEIEASVATILLKSGAEQQKVFDQLKVTEARIEQFVQMLKAPTLQRPDPTALATLESLITTVQNSRNIVNPDKQQIKAVEADVFSLLEEVNRASSSDDIKSLEPRLLKQVKSVATLRASIEKKIEKKDNPVENKVLVNQVEDLQENLADIQFTLTEKKKNLMPDISEDKNHRTEVLLSKKKKEKSFYDDL